VILPKRTRHLRLLLISISVFLANSISQSRPVPLSSGEPVIRINLADNAWNPWLRVLGKFILSIQGIEIATVTDASISFAFSHDGTPIVRLPNQEIKFSYPIKLEPAETDTHKTRTDSTVKIPEEVSSNFASGIKFHLQTFPGSVEIIPENNGTFRVINFVRVETYLRGVVPNELVNKLTPDEFQACMAQAIAARNFALYKMDNQDTADFDVYSDTRGQVYSGIEKYKPLADSAIKLTSGMIVEYDGQPARCFFHSTCGGHTESVQNIWQGQPALPYLAGVSDIDSATGDPYCIYSPQFYWTNTYSHYQINKMIRDNLAVANPTYVDRIIRSDITDIKILDRFESYRVDSLRIKTKNGNVYYVRGDRTRYLLRNNDGTLLSSSLFRIIVSKDGSGRLGKITVTGEGIGHGVGMCQWGAIGMSRLGYNYLQILSHYFPGTEVKKVY